MLIFYKQQQSYLRVLLWATTLWNTAGQTELHLGDERLLSDISCHRSEEACLW